MDNELPLVSVVVVTYNSSKTIIETLDSIKKQTYKNIELIVSDDCSKDDTVNICKEWIDKNSSRFTSTITITTPQNTGTAGNLNRGFQKAKGIWIKPIAGDDVLIESCIESNVNYVLDNPQTQILLSKVQLIGDKNKIEKYKNLFNYGALKLKQKELLYLLLTKNFLPASTLFIRKDIFLELGGYDESIPLLEDWPFWIKALYNKKTISFNDEYTVYYRMSESSISLTSNPNPLYLHSIQIFITKFLPEYQRKTNILIWVYSKTIEYRRDKRYVIRILSIIFTRLNPMTYYLNRLNKRTITK